MNIGEFIKSYRQEHGLSQADFASRSGISKDYISMLENNKNPQSGMPIAPSFSIFEKVSSAVGISTEDLIRSMGDEQLITMMSNPITFTGNIVPLPRMGSVPLVGDIACGEPILAAENVSEYVDLPEHIRADFALRCKGDSMINARIYDGDIVYIRQQPTVDDGQIAAVLVGDEATLKRVRFFPDHVVLEAENPNVRPFVYWEDEMNDLRILGLAVAFTSAVF